jgi:hypothetical protein
VGVFGFHGSGRAGPCGSIDGGGGVPCCAFEIGVNNRAADNKIMRRFMNAGPAELNSVLENQDSDLHHQTAFSDTTDRTHAFYVQISE